jgi:aldehyde:ferredoxin oxidoreductase
MKRSDGPKMKGSAPGYSGGILSVDLARRTHRVSPLPSELIERFIGGKGFGIKILYDELTPGCDPLSPGNIIVLAVGPMTGTLVPTSSRIVLATRSPLTGIWLDTNCGGTFGPELKRTGFDVVKITGKADSPVYLVIDDGEVRLEEAAPVWGKDAIQTNRWIKEAEGNDFRIACIGQAGEKRIPMAAVIAEGRAFGRGGSGAVMGSKNLKAIAVRGSAGIRVHDHDEFLRENREAFNEILINPDTGGTRPLYGTPAIYSHVREAGALPIRNFQGGGYPRMEKVDEEAVLRELIEARYSCFGCPIGCGKLSVAKKGIFKGKRIDGPEYENLWSFGAQCGNTDLSAVLEAEYLCDSYGLDSISSGNAIGFTMECFEKGLLDDSEIGFSAGFGDAKAMIELLHMIGKGEGIGELLGQGVRRAARKIGAGSEDFAMHVKGLELPAFDPRAVFGMGLAYATGDRGGCHLRSWTVGQEILESRDRIDPFSTEYKAELVATQQDWFSVLNSVGICFFATFALGPNQIAGLLYALTGVESFSSVEKLMRIGERIYTLTRLFNLREGITGSDDSLPPRLLREPMPEGPAEGKTVPLAAMLSEYYRLRGWDEEGRPAHSKLVELGLE